MTEPSIRTAGELRGFLADVLIGIRDKRVTPDEAGAIAKVAGEINRSLAVEVQTALQSGIARPVAGSMVIATPADAGLPALLAEGEGNEPEPDEAPPPSPVPLPVRATTTPVRVAPKPKAGDSDKLWCDQCEMRVTTSQAVGCKSAFCKAREVA